MPKSFSRKPFSWGEAALLLGLGVLGVLLLRPFLSNLRPAAQNTACTTNLRQLHLAVTQYEYANDGYLPPTDTVASFDAALRPFVPTPSVLVCPDTGLPYVPNPALSRMSLGSVSGDLDTIILAQDAQPDADGQSSVVYLDGTVEHGGEQVGDPATIVAERARHLGLGVTQYTQDNDELYPPTDTPAHFEAAVDPFVKSHRAFDAPNGQPFVPNAALSGVSIASINDPATTVLLQDQAPYVDGVQTICYADGHVERGGVDARGNPAQVVTSNAKRLGLAVTQYTQDSDEFFPPTDTPEHFQTAVYSYVKDHQVFYSPNGLAFVPNPALSGASLASIADPASTILLQDQPPYVDGAPTILYTDGHVSHVVQAHTHLLWTRPDGRAALWSIDPAGNVAVAGYGPYADGAGTWKAVALATGGGDSRLLWTRSDGRAALWDVDAAGNVASVTGYGPYTDTDGSTWTATALSLGPDDLPHLVWATPTGRTVLWNVYADGSAQIADVYGPTPDGATGHPYHPASLSVGLDGTPHLLWDGPSGRAMLWDAKPDGTYDVTGIYGPYTDNTGAAWRGVALSHGPDDVGHVLWTQPSGAALLWTLNADGTYRTAGTYGPYTDSDSGGLWAATALAVGPDGPARLLWTNPDGHAALWTVQPSGTFALTLYGPYPVGDSSGTFWTPVAISAGP